MYYIIEGDYNIKTVFFAILRNKSVNMTLDKCTIVYKLESAVE